MCVVETILILLQTYYLLYLLGFSTSVVSPATVEKDSIVVYLYVCFVISF